jgi:hypothetical protein
MEFVLLFLQSEGSSHCSGLDSNCKSIQTEMLEMKGKCVWTEIFGCNLSGLPKKKNSENSDGTVKTSVSLHGYSAAYQLQKDCKIVTQEPSLR